MKTISATKGELMQLLPGTSAHGFAVATNEELPEIDGRAITALHEKSGARLLYLQNDDNNKSFAIGFKTPPQDDTGVFHILEHSVLCGSRKFPVKEPFVDLLKGSMQTFLNAMTFADKTLYPVASTNEQDLFNLMDVYLDAVFHPRIFEKRAIFEQEGWHYELRRSDGTPVGPDELDASDTQLLYNGVVYNEMKGALSDSSSVLYDELQKALFPDNCYAFESGGTPEAIPTLTYENYLEEHRRHYRTDNSYIILYGNLDIDRTLAFLDERYLSPVADEQAQVDAQRKDAGLEKLVPRAIVPQAPIKAAFLQREMDTAPENAVAACGYVIGDASERLRSVACEILLDALFGSNEAPLKRALLDSGIAHDVSAYVSDALLQPFAIVQVHMPEKDAAAGLAQTVEDAVRRLLAQSLDRELVEAALSHAEFVMREHDMGMSDGVIHAMTALSSWLYDDTAATDYLRYETAFKKLRAQLDEGYFEQLCRELFLENDHTAAVEIVPVPGKSEDGSLALLQQLNRSLSPEDRKRIIEEEALLRELQETPDSPEAVATLPRLHVSDIGPAPEEPAYALDAERALPCIRHEVSTHGIAYASRYFDVNRMTFEDLPYIGVLACVLGKLDTDAHTAAQIDTLVQGKLGSLHFFVEVFEDAHDPDAATPKFVVSTSALSGNVEWAARLPREILLDTDYSDKGKILDVLKQRKIELEQSFAGAGHLCASARCKSYYAPAGVIREQVRNVGFYQFVCSLIENYDECANDLAKRLADTAKRLFVDNGCLASFAGSPDDYERFWQADPACGRTGSSQHALEVPAPEVLNEAFVVPSDVCYAAFGWDRRLLGREHDGSWTVASKALSLDYLWNEVRVKGGAYGVGFQALRSGNMRFYSYRDPHLDETLQRFENAGPWLSEFSCPADEFEGFVVSSVAGIDAPVKPRELTRRQANDFIVGLSPEQRRELRQQIADTSLDDVRAFSEALEDMTGKAAVCVFGNREILQSSKRDLTLVNLVG